MSKIYHSPSKHASFVIERISSYILNKFGTLDAVSIAISTEDKLYLIHKNFLNNERKVNNSFTQYQVLESICLSMKNAILILINIAYNRLCS